MVGDWANNRVLVWNQLPTSNFQPADLVLGQADFDRRVENDGNQDGNPDAERPAQTLRRPHSIASNGVQLAVSEDSNHRVLIWNSLPTANFQPADMVLGQSRFDLRASNDTDQDGQANPSTSPASASAMSRPKGLLFHEDKLFVVDNNNSRVLVFRSK